MILCERMRSSCGWKVAATPTGNSASSVGKPTIGKRPVHAWAGLFVTFRVTEQVSNGLLPGSIS